MESRWKASLVMGLIALWGGWAYAQAPTGSIYGRVTDPDGKPLPGVVVTLKSPAIGELHAVTTLNGLYIFPSLPPGADYRLEFSLTGFRTVVRKAVEVLAGTNTRVDIQMAPGAVETVVVTGAAQAVDIKEAEVAANFTREILRDIPIARDPWVMLSLAPGVFVELERLDGGSEMGRESDFTARGAEWRDNQWLLDGVPITVPGTSPISGGDPEMRPRPVMGTSPIYFDFSALEEIQVSTGGTDVEAFTGGVIINIVTRRGRNQPAAEARFLWAGDELQGENVTKELREKLAPELEADRIQEVRDYGLQAGGALRRNRFWVWGSYGALDYDLLVPTVEEEGDEEVEEIDLGIFQELQEDEEEALRTEFQHDTRDLDHFTVKTHARLDEHIVELMAVGSLHRRWGFQAEFERPPETTYNQREWMTLVKAQDEWLVNSNLFLSGKVSWYRTRNRLIPRGGTNRPAWLDYRTGIWTNSFSWADTLTRSLDTSFQAIFYRLHALGGHHELKFGVEFRDSAIRHAEGFANGVVFALFDMEELERGGEVWLIREGQARIFVRRWSLYMQDAVTWNRLTATLGLRWDIQKNGLLPSETPAHPWRPDWLPAGRQEARSMPFTWSTLSPRISLGYDLRGDGQTAIKASFALYPSALGIDEPLSLAATGRRELRFRWLGDLNENGQPDPNEIDFTQPTFWDHALGAPNRVVNTVADDYRSPRTLELTLGMEHAIGAHWRVALTGFYRRSWDYVWTFPYDPNGRFRDRDFYDCWVQVGTLPSEWGGWPYYACTIPKPAGVRWENRPSFSTRYVGWEFRVTGRTVNGWWVLGSLTLQQSLQFMHDRRAWLDPTNVEQFNRGPYFTTGWETDVFNHIRWMLKVGGWVPLPLDFSLSWMLIARDGLLYQSIFRARRPSNGWGALVDVYTDRLDRYRLPTFWLLNLRLERRLQLGMLGSVTLIVEGFNILNRALATRKFGMANVPALYDRITEIISPRIFRIGIRYTM